MSTLTLTQTLIVASAISAPDDNNSLPLTPLTSAQIVLPSSHFSATWPEGSLEVVIFWIVMRSLRRPACINPP